MSNPPYRICQHGLNQDRCSQPACMREYNNVLNFGTPHPKPKPDLSATGSYRQRQVHPGMLIYKRAPPEPPKEPWPTLWDDLLPPPEATPNPKDKTAVEALEAFGGSMKALHECHLKFLEEAYRGMPKPIYMFDPGKLTIEQIKAIKPKSVIVGHGIHRIITDNPYEPIPFTPATKIVEPSKPQEQKDHLEVFKAVQKELEANPDLQQVYDLAKLAKWFETEPKP